jgi:hypothetical protein
MAAPNNDKLLYELGTKLGPALQAILEQINWAPKQINCLQELNNGISTSQEQF